MNDNGNILEYKTIFLLKNEIRIAIDILYIYLENLAKFKEIKDEEKSKARKEEK